METKIKKPRKRRKSLNKKLNKEQCQSDLENPEYLAHWLAFSNALQAIFTAGEKKNMSGDEVIELINAKKVYSEYISPIVGDIMYCIENQIHWESHMNLR